MMPANGTEHAVSSPPALDLGTTLAFERTRIAYERTMMAWVRTATSLITFGFSVYKFFQLEMPAKSLGRILIGPREFGLALIAIGLVSLLLGTIEHGRDLGALRRKYPAMPRSMTGVAVCGIAVLGIFALLAVALRD
jgi:putative membrane protein